MIYRIVLAWLFCLFADNGLTQDLHVANLRKKYVDSVDSILKINKDSLMSGKDSVVIMHFKGAVYQIYKRDNAFQIVRTLMILKQIKKSARTEAFKTIMRTDTLPAQKPDNEFLNSTIFSVLFDLSNAEGDKMTLNFKMPLKGRPGMLDLYLESINNNNYRFQELLPVFVDKIVVQGKGLDAVLRDLFSNLKHWEAIESMVRKGGFGIYTYSNYNMGILFEFKKNGKFQLDGYPREMVKVPRL